MGASISRIIFALIFGFFSACSIYGDNNCNNEYIYFNLDPSLLDWFNKIADSGYYKTIKSQKGLSDDLYQNGSTFYSSGNSSATEPCHIYSSQEKTMDYSSILYKFNFTFKIIQEKDGPYFSCETYDDKNRLVKIRKNLATGMANPITIQKYGSYEDSATTYLSEFIIQDSLVVPNKTYYNVYKITNNLFKSVGNSFSITEFYLDKSEGLIQFVQKNGDVWRY